MHHLKKLHLVLLIFLQVNVFASADTLLIKKHLTTITKTPKYRNFQNIDQLNKTASYIQSIFAKYSDSIAIQQYPVDGKTYKNIICSFGPAQAKRIIVGAHYDVCGNQEGADDNASGIVALLEIARLLKGKELNYRVDLVAYTLEEPPYFRTEYMGSYIHAKSLIDQKVDVFGMISVEMIGYFKDEKKSQSYPVGLLSLLYGNKGNYITLVNKSTQGKFARQFSREFRDTKSIRTKKFRAPRILPGIDFSDHLNYWNFGLSALMITDTSFFRNKNYHQTTDTMETLDVTRMAMVIDGILDSIIALK